MTDASLSAKVTADIADFMKKFDDMKGSIDHLSSGMSGNAGKANDSLNEMKQNISTIGGLLKSGALVEGGKMLTEAVTIPIINLGREAVMLADKLRQSEIAFTTMLGSADKAKSFLRDLQAFAAATPFEFPELVQSAKKMMALGFSAEQVIPNLRAVGDAVAGLGGNAGTFDRIILALGQMQAKGQVMSGEMRQLAEAGIPAWDILAHKLGVTVPEAMEMVSKKAVDANTGVAAMMEGMAQRFGGLMEQQSQTIQGTLANLHDTINFLMTDIGRELIETLKIREGLAAIQEFAKGFLSWFKELDSGTKQVLLVLTGVFAVGGPILVAVGAFMAAMTLITAPLLIGGAIIAGIIAGVTLLILNWQKVKDTGIAIWTNLRDVVVGTVKLMVDQIYENLIGRFVTIVQGVKQSTEAVAGFFYDLWTKVTRRSYIPDMVDDIQRHMENLDVAMVAPARNATVQTGRIIEGAAMTWQASINQFVSTINFMWGSMAQTVGMNLAKMTTDTVNWAQVGIQMGQQFLGNLITTAIQVMTQWVLSATGISAAWTAMETAKTTATATGEAARLAISKTTNTLIATGTLAALAGIVALGNGAVAVMTAVMLAASAMMAAIAGALNEGVYTAWMAPPIAAASGTLAAGAATMGPAASAAIQAAAGAAIVASTVAGFARGGIGDFGTGTPAMLHGREAIIPLNQRGAAVMQEALGMNGGRAGSRPIIHTHVFLKDREIALAVSDEQPSALFQMGVL